MSPNGAKNNSQIVTKITAVQPKGGVLAQAPPPKYATRAADPQAAVTLTYLFIQAKRSSSVVTFVVE